MLELAGTVGKRNKEIKMAAAGARADGGECRDLMRNLKFLFSQVFNNHSQLLRTNALYENKPMVKTGFH